MPPKTTFIRQPQPGGPAVNERQKNGYVKWPQIITILSIVFVIIGFVIGNAISKQDAVIEAVSKRQDKVEDTVSSLNKSVSTLEECVKWLQKYTGVK